MDRRDPEPDLQKELDALLAGVLERTSGPACRRAEALLASASGFGEPADGRAGDAPEEELPAVDRELVDLHLAGCAECRALAAVLAGLARDLPRLAEVRPAPGFAEDVLAATLPPAARWRRRRRAWGLTWSRTWSETWPRWVRRPRFAWEAAFALTLVALPIFAAPEAPLHDVPERALELGRENPVARLEAPIAELEERLASGIPAVRRSAPAGLLVGPRATLGKWSARLERTVLGALSERLDPAGLTDLAEGAVRLLEVGRADLGTFLERAASLLVSGDETPRAIPNDPTEETTP